MPTLVSTLDIHLSDRRLRTKKASFRASHPEIENFNEASFQLSLGQATEINVGSFMYAYLRDFTTVTLLNLETNETVVLGEVQGILTLPLKNYKVTFSVDASSTIELERVIHLIYG